MLKSKIFCMLAVVVICFTACAHREGFSSSLSYDGSSSSSSSSSTLSSSSSSSISSSLSSMSSSNSEQSAPAMGVDFSKLSSLDSTGQGWGQGVNFDDLNRPIGSTAFQEKYGKHNAYFIAPTEEKVIYLTFDLGWENGYTKPIIDVLDEKGVPALFFVTYDYAKGQTEIMQRLASSNHVIGNHSYSHPDDFASLPLSSAYEDIQKLQEYVKENYNYDMKYFRFPAGRFSEQDLGLVQQMGMCSVFWSFAYRDWLVDDQPTYSDAYQRLTERLHPGAIYLLHAVSKTNAEVLGDFIDYAIQEGYTFKTFDY